MPSSATRTPAEAPILTFPVSGQGQDCLHHPFAMVMTSAAGPGCTDERSELVAAHGASKSSLLVALEALEAHLSQQLVTSGLPQGCRRRADRLRAPPEIFRYDGQPAGRPRR